MGFAADRALGDPARLHPVAGFGAAAAALERVLWSPRRVSGIAHVVALVAAVGAAAVVVVRRRPLVAAALVWATLGGRSLERAALRLAASLEAGDVEEARRLAPALVGRDPSRLDAAELSRAAVESVAENTNDAVVAPLLWAAAWGAPAAAAYRAVNTLDAMIGHKHDRYRKFGWFAARLDDCASWPPARLTVLLAAACAPLVGGSARAAWRAAWEDGRRHPSPNAGRVEGAFAGALGLRLGGLNHYAHGAERRPDLGGGRPPDVTDIRRAVVLARLVGAAAVLVALGAARR
ncbi:MAG TPA: adenosylcobinamide-phosphate synthase CbiB [Gaiellaceae bacterium]|nr:adenosylcobinamide-phosphate synthase CbiB [Gaiellaceae bacterium]